MSIQTSFSVTGQVVDVVTGNIFPGTVHVSNGIITGIEPVQASGGPFILPGLIDAHIHIESSMLTPAEFARMAVVHGTVASVSDPHEIANVLGMDGVTFMLENGRSTPFRFYFGAPSCVPATGFESSGAVLGPEAVELLLAKPEIRYLSEMMNFPGVIYADPEVSKKLDAARKHGKPVDGHAPGLSGEALGKYAGAGISTDHECTSIEEALEKIGYGMNILIREGSAARNFDVLSPLLKTHPGNVMFCSDDKHPDDLLKGHMNLLLRRAVEAGHDPVTAIRACTLNPVRHYKLDCGLLQAGDPADFILVDSLESFRVTATYINGLLVASEGRTSIQPVQTLRPNRFRMMDITASMLRVPAEPGLIRVIQAFDGELLTGKLLLEPRVLDGSAVSDPERDILKIAVINRYKPSLPAIGFIRGVGLKQGALASTVAHDSHNLICIGTSDQEMLDAIQLISMHQGGIAVTDGSRSEVLPLPVAGIMTDADGSTVAETYQSLNNFAHALGSSLRAPFMTLSFMALLVIPELKLSDKGLFDGNSFSFTSLFEK